MCIIKSSQSSNSAGTARWQLAVMPGGGSREVTVFQSRLSKSFATFFYDTQELHAVPSPVMLGAAASAPVLSMRGCLLVAFLPVQRGTSAINPSASVKRC